MTRLGSASLLPSSVRRPAYDRAALRPGIVHLGIGAFHRAHQAVYTDAALAHRFGDWGIVGVSLRSTAIVEDLRRQDGLFGVVTRGAAGDAAQVVGCVIDALAASREGERLLALLADPAIRIVTLTVTEKAYGLDPATGGLDERHAAVAADLAHPGEPVGVLGFIVEGLARRRAAGHPPFTALSCDNLPDNGGVLRRLVLAMAARREAGLAEWIARHGRFPSSMVDRIVPAATEETRGRAAALLGAEDALAVETEPFSQWVIEDDFAAGRPDWEAGGALFVKSVAPYELMKLRLLNGAHSLIAYHSQLNGVELVRDAMRDPALVALVRRQMQAVLPVLDPVPGIDLADYVERLLERFANPAIAHRTAQIAMDGSQKLPQRIFAPAAASLRSGGDGDAFALTTALWLAYLVRTERPDDPRAEVLKRAADVRPPGDLTAGFFAIDGLFPPGLAADRDWRDRVNRHFACALGLEF
ncbi:mannitol dehydrogenase [Aureimonas endophytica]|uniref:Mannitol dehydrogenase n=1 Tax=Aureimonas endophytica TaxID=2027858 RepID=A0A917E5S5_9HYPH|nr:mannitol dehydrogenase family protein [Aureimonas endophytica]GGE05795.1 mannitol dehydrogenase [Aureimonas endophytica]